MNRVGDTLENGARGLVCLTIPRSKWITVTSAAAGWYGRQYALTYGPGYLADIFIEQVTKACYFEYFEGACRKLGETTAPLWVPAAMPTTSYVVGVVTAIIAIILGNILHILVVLICREIKKPQPGQLHASPC